MAQNEWGNFIGKYPNFKETVNRRDLYPPFERAVPFMKTPEASHSDFHWKPAARGLGGSKINPEV